MYCKLKNNKTGGSDGVVGNCLGMGNRNGGPAASAKLIGIKKLYLNSGGRD